MNITMQFDNMEVNKHKQVNSGLWEMQESGRRDDLPLHSSYVTVWLIKSCIHIFGEHKNLITNLGPDNAGYVLL